MQSPDQLAAVGPVRDAQHQVLADVGRRPLEQRTGLDVDVRRKLLEEALTVFDAATVTTTHGFCQQVLLALGTAGDHDTGAVLVESIGDLVAEVADDLYLRKWGAAGSAPADMTQAEFHALAMAAATDPATDLLPPTATDGMPGQRARIAAGRARRGRPAQAAPAAHRLRRHAAAAQGHPHRRDVGPGREGPAAGALPGGAGRRVPGHRPGAVGDPARGLPRPPHPGADRRPEAGHLRLPRRRRARLPRGARVGVGGAHAADQPPQRRRRCSTGWPRSSVAQRSATSGSGCCRSRPRTTGGWSTRRCRCSCGCVPRDGGLPVTGNGTLATAAGPRRVVRDLADRVVALLSGEASAAAARRHRPAAGRAQGHRGAGAHQHPGRAGAGAAAGRRRARRAHRQDLGLRHPRGRGVAAAARGAGAAAPDHPGTPGSADLLRRARRGRAGRGR